jgi:hypothetical protein
MPNWCESSTTRQDHRRLINEALSLLRVRYPGHPLDYDVAIKLWARENNKPDDFLRLNCPEGIVTKSSFETKKWKIRCPECGGKVGFHILPGCLKANPRKYTMQFTCNKCLWHGWSKQGLTDIFKKLNANRFHELELFIAE